MKYALTIISSVALIVLQGCNSSQNQSSLEPIDNNNDGRYVKLQPRVIYGQDDRLDLYQVLDLSWLEKSSASVALVRSYKLTKNDGSSDYKITTSHYGQSMGLCKKEPFYNQVTAAFCSGSLIAPDIVMTAGHCIRTASSCADTKFVFNFAYHTEGVDPKVAAEDDVYSCKELIYSEVNSSNSSDFALVRLDRSVVGRTPLAIRTEGQVAAGDPLVVIGHPSGLPTKVAGGASVRSTSPQTYFIANLDTYGGNSGSAVFNADTGIVEGILVRGERDFTSQGGCTVSNVCADNGCRGEDVTRVSEVLKYLDVNELVPGDENENVDGLVDIQ